MSPKYIFATIGVVCSIVSIFVVGLPLLAGGVVFVGVAHFVP